MLKRLLRSRLLFGPPIALGWWCDHAAVSGRDPKEGRIGYHASVSPGGKPELTAKGIDTTDQVNRRIEIID